MWNVVNSLLAGALVFLGALTDGGITWQSAITAVVAAGIVAIVQFKSYWETEEPQYKTLGTFI